jgi:ParB family transcriptional regulator, chromosome partitioning protein
MIPLTQHPERILSAPTEPLKPDLTLFGQIQLIGVIYLTPCPHNPRVDNEDPEEDQRLLDDVKRVGIVNPIIGYPGEGGMVNMIAGHRRLSAAIEAGRFNVPVMLFDVSGMTPVEIRARVLSDNTQHVPISPLPKARFVKAMMTDFALTQAQAAEQLKMDPSAVGELVGLLELPQEVQRHLEKLRLRLIHGTQLVRHMRKLKNESSLDDDKIGAQITALATQIAAGQSLETLLGTTTQPKPKKAAKGGAHRASLMITGPGSVTGEIKFPDGANGVDVLSVLEDLKNAVKKKFGMD